MFVYQGMIPKYNIFTNKINSSLVQLIFIQFRLNYQISRSMHLSRELLDK